MENKENKSIYSIMRALHRDLGFLILGFVIIYSLSGITLVYRGTNFMKHDVTIERKLAPNLTDQELGMEMRQRDFKVEKTEGETLYFSNGSYNKTTGMAVFTIKEVRFPFNKFNELHKISSSDGKHWVTIVFGILLLFMAITSFWMFKPKTKAFQRAMIYTAAGVLICVLLLLL
jgi:hypothetical protein